VGSVVGRYDENGKRLSRLSGLRRCGRRGIRNGRSTTVETLSPRLYSKQSLAQYAARARVGQVLLARAIFRPLAARELFTNRWRHGAIESNAFLVIDMTAPQSHPTTCILTALAIVVVGWLDYITGAEVRVLALYFMPLLYAGWRLGSVGATSAAVFAAATWVTVLCLTGVRFSNPYIWIINAVTEGGGFLIVALLVAKLRDAIDRERIQSRRDPLTGLANRREFMELANTAVAISQRHRRCFSLIYVDLDNFKNVNDTFGHHRGDELLLRCAGLIVACVRTTDTVARLGGDEFAVLLTETDAGHADRLGERIRKAIDRDSVFKEVGVTASIGVANNLEAETDVDTLLRQADARMYEAKRGRKIRPLRSIRQLTKMRRQP
jgi:diguanylate cyclase (GGDEF)-like protein